MSEKKTWSLQKDKRSEVQRNVFKPTGKKHKSKIANYIIWALVMVLVSSFALTFTQKEAKEICFTSTICFNSKEDVLIYTFYVFLNIIIIVLVILAAYIIGKKLANSIKK